MDIIPAADVQPHVADIFSGGVKGDEIAGLDILRLDCRALLGLIVRHALQLVAELAVYIAHEAGAVKARFRGASAVFVLPAEELQGEIRSLAAEKLLRRGLCLRRFRFLRGVARSGAQHGGGIFHTAAGEGEPPRASPGGDRRLRCPPGEALREEAQSDRADVLRPGKRRAAAYACSAGEELKPVPAAACVPFRQREQPRER